MTTTQRQRTSGARHSRIGDEFVASPTATAQKPYANGVTVWNDSGSAGRGFSYTAKIAVLDGVIVGLYFSEYMRRRATVRTLTGERELHADVDYGNGRVRPYVTRTALSKWVEAMKTYPEPTTATTEPPIASPIRRNAR